MSLSNSRNIYLVIFFVLLFPNASIGWDCPPGTPEQWFVSSDIVFEGKVVYKEGVRSSKSSDIKGVDVTFEVTKALKGNLDGLVKVRTGTFGFTPGYPFLCGEYYVVYASKNETDNIYRTSVCTPTNPLNKDVPSYDELEMIIFDNSPDILESRKEEILSKWRQRCPEYPEFVFTGNASKIFELKSCEWISGLTCRIKYNGELPYPKELFYSTYDSGGRIMKINKSLKWWGPKHLDKGETGIFTFRDYGYQEPLKIEIEGVWE